MSMGLSLSLSLTHKDEIYKFQIVPTEYKLGDKLKEWHPPHYEPPAVSQNTENLSQQDRKNRANNN